jgi:hypothetical protein
MTSLDEFDELQSRVNKIRIAIRDGSIGSTDRETVEKYNVWLADPGVSLAFSGEYQHICELARLHLQMVFVREMGRRNEIIQWCVVLLTVFSALGTAAQIWYAERSDRRAQAEAVQTAPPGRSEVSTPAYPQTPATAASTAGVDKSARQ